MNLSTCLSPPHARPLAALTIALALAVPSVVRADDAPPPSSSAGAAPAAKVQAVQAPEGLAVLALPGAASVAWPLAQKIYASPALRPRTLDEARARVLAGEAPDPTAPAELRDLAEMRAAVKGDDAPSRAVLSSVARAANVRGVVVVEAHEGQTSSARVFVAEGQSFDAARYVPDAGPAGGWDGAVASLTRAFGTPAPRPPAAAAPPSSAAPIDAKKPSREEPSTSRPFYGSPWFWGAIGAAAFGAGAIYFATRDNDGQTIHLQMQVPK